MKKLSNTEAELKKAMLIKKSVYSWKYYVALVAYQLLYRFLACLSWLYRIIELVLSLLGIIVCIHALRI